MDIDAKTLQDIRDVQQLGFVTALNGAGYDANDINRLYTAYETQRESRESTLETAYNAIVGRE
jgi:hypothetical protein